MQIWGLRKRRKVQFLLVGYFLQLAVTEDFFQGMGKNSKYCLLLNNMVIIFYQTGRSACRYPIITVLTHYRFDPKQEAS